MTDTSIYGKSNYLGMPLHGVINGEDDEKKKGFQDLLEETSKVSNHLRFNALANPEGDFLFEEQWRAKQLPLFLAKKEKEMRSFDPQRIISTDVDGELDEAFAEICNYGAPEAVIKIDSNLLVNNEVAKIPVIIKTKDLIDHLRPYADIYFNNEKHKVCHFVEYGDHFWVPKKEFVINRSSPIIQSNGHGIKSKQGHSLIYGVRATDVPGIAPADRFDLNKYDFSQIKSCLLYTSPSPRDSCASRMPSSA